MSNMHTPGSGDDVQLATDGWRSSLGITLGDGAHASRSANDGLDRFIHQRLPSLPSLTATALSVQGLGIGSASDALYRPFEPVTEFHASTARDVSPSPFTARSTVRSGQNRLGVRPWDMAGDESSLLTDLHAPRAQGELLRSSHGGDGSDSPLATRASVRPGLSTDLYSTLTQSLQTPWLRHTAHSIPRDIIAPSSRQAAHTSIQVLRPREQSSLTELRKSSEFPSTQRAGSLSTEPMNRPYTEPVLPLSTAQERTQSYVTIPLMETGFKAQDRTSPLQFAPTLQMEWSSAHQSDFLPLSTERTPLRQDFTTQPTVASQMASSGTPALEPIRLHELQLLRPTQRPALEDRESQPERRDSRAVESSRVLRADNTGSRAEMHFVTPAAEREPERSIDARIAPSTVQSMPPETILPQQRVSDVSAPDPAFHASPQVAEYRPTDAFSSTPTFTVSSQPTSAAETPAGPTSVMEISPPRSVEAVPAPPLQNDTQRLTATDSSASLAEGISEPLTSAPYAPEMISSGAPGAVRQVMQSTASDSGASITLETQALNTSTPFSNWTSVTEALLPENRATVSAPDFSPIHEAGVGPQALPEGVAASGSPIASGSNQQEQRLQSPIVPADSNFKSAHSAAPSHLANIFEASILDDAIRATQAQEVVAPELSRDIQSPVAMTENFASEELTSGVLSQGTQPQRTVTALPSHDWTASLPQIADLVQHLSPVSTESFSLQRNASAPTEGLLVSEHSLRTEADSRDLIAESILNYIAQLAGSESSSFELSPPTLLSLVNRALGYETSSVDPTTSTSGTGDQWPTPQRPVAQILSPLSQNPGLLEAAATLLAASRPRPIAENASPRGQASRSDSKLPIVSGGTPQALTELSSSPRLTTPEPIENLIQAYAAFQSASHSWMTPAQSLLTPERERGEQSPLIDIASSRLLAEDITVAQNSMLRYAPESQAFTAKPVIEARTNEEKSQQSQLAPQLDSFLNTPALSAARQAQSDLVAITGLSHGTPQPNGQTPVQQQTYPMARIWRPELEPVPMLSPFGQVSPTGTEPVNIVNVKGEEAGTVLRGLAAPGAPKLPQEFTHIEPGRGQQNVDLNAGPSSVIEWPQVSRSGGVPTPIVTPRTSHGILQRRDYQEVTAEPRTAEQLSTSLLTLLRTLDRGNPALTAQTTSPSIRSFEAPQQRSIQDSRLEKSALLRAEIEPRFEAPGQQVSRTWDNSSPYTPTQIATPVTAHEQTTGSQQELGDHFRKSVAENVAESLAQSRSQRQDRSSLEVSLPTQSEWQDRSTGLSQGIPGISLSSPVEVTPDALAYWTELGLESPLVQPTRIATVRNLIAQTLEADPTADIAQPRFNAPASVQSLLNPYATVSTPQQTELPSQGLALQDAELPSLLPDWIQNPGQYGLTELTSLARILMDDLNTGKGDVSKPLSLNAWPVESANSPIALRFLELGRKIQASQSPSSNLGFMPHEGAQTLRQGSFAAQPQGTGDTNTANLRPFAWLDLAALPDLNTDARALGTTPFNWEQSPLSIDGKRGQAAPNLDRPLTSSTQNEPLSLLQHQLSTSPVLGSIVSDTMRFSEPQLLQATDRFGLNEVTTSLPEVGQIQPGMDLITWLQHVVGGLGTTARTSMMPESSSFVATAPAQAGTGPFSWLNPISRQIAQNLVSVAGERPAHALRMEEALGPVGMIPSRFAAGASALVPAFDARDSIAYENPLNQDYPLAPVQPSGEVPLSSVDRIGVSPESDLLREVLLHQPALQQIVRENRSFQQTLLLQPELRHALISQPTLKEAVQAQPLLRQVLHQHGMGPDDIELQYQVSGSTPVRRDRATDSSMKEELLNPYLSIRPIEVDALLRTPLPAEQTFRSAPDTLDKRRSRAEGERPASSPNSPFVVDVDAEAFRTVTDTLPLLTPERSAEVVTQPDGQTPRADSPRSEVESAFIQSPTQAFNTTGLSWLASREPLYDDDAYSDRPVVQALSARKPPVAGQSMDQLVRGLERMFAVPRGTESSTQAAPQPAFSARDAAPRASDGGDSVGPIRVLLGHTPTELPASTVYPDRDMAYPLATETLYSREAAQSSVFPDEVQLERAQPASSRENNISELTEALARTWNVALPGTTQAPDQRLLTNVLLTREPLARDSGGEAQNVYMANEPEHTLPPLKEKMEDEKLQGPLDVRGMEQVVSELRWRLQLNEKWDEERE